MTPALAIALITALLGDLPQIIAEVEKLIAAAKGQPVAPSPPIADDLGKIMQAADDKLNTPEK